MFTLWLIEGEVNYTITFSLSIFTYIYSLCTVRSAYPFIIISANVHYYRWICFKCDLTYSKEKVSWRFRISLRVSDASAVCNVCVFGATLDQYFGDSAYKFHRLQLLFHILNIINIWQKTNYVNDLQSSDMFDNSKLFGFFYYQIINVPFIQFSCVDIMVSYSTKFFS